MSLPLAFGTALETIPAAVPYLRVPLDRARAWLGRLARERRCASVSPGKAARFTRTITTVRSHSRRFAALLSVPGIEFVSLQKDLTARRRPRRCAAIKRHRDRSELRDFADTAAVISALDLVVSADTSVVHLAGALGKPVWVLLPFLPDFRWLLGREDSPWYPTARLFRQPRLGDWESVLARCAANWSRFGTSRPLIRTMM